MGWLSSNWKCWSAPPSSKPPAHWSDSCCKGAADRIDASYQPKPGQQYKGRFSVQVDGIFGCSELKRDYYHHPGKEQGHYPADAALGLEEGRTPALVRLVCLEGADEPSYQKAENHLETGGIKISARQIQRAV